MPWDVTDAEGNWVGKYVPAFVRRYPFVFSSNDGENFTLCVDDPHAHAAELTCAEHENPHYPPNKKVKPFCEPVGSCGFGRVPVASPIKGKLQCVPK